MTYEEKETRTTYAGDSVTVRVARRTVAHAPLASCLLSPEPFMVSGGKSGQFRVSCTWVASTSELHNSVVYDVELLILWFAPDLSSVHVEWDHRSDMTS